MGINPPHGEREGLDTPRLRCHCASHATQPTQLAPKTQKNRTGSVSSINANAVVVVRCIYAGIPRLRHAPTPTRPTRLYTSNTSDTRDFLARKSVSVSCVCVGAVEWQLHVAYTGNRQIVFLLAYKLLHIIPVVDGHCLSRQPLSSQQQSSSTIV